MASVVLDSSAVLAVLNAEEGADVVIAALDDAVMSTVNYAEVVSKLVQRGVTPVQARAAIERIDIGVVDFDVLLAHRTGTLGADTRHLGLSLADRACLALAERERAPVLTSDRIWMGTLASVEVRLIR